MRAIAGAILLFVSTLYAQQPAPAVQPAAPGQVTGRVFCADTGQPGRFAGVQLIAEQPSKESIFNPAALGKNPDFGKLFATAMTAAMKGSNLSTITSIDGTFSLDKVPPGNYYVIAQLPGYESPLSRFSQVERMKPDEATLKAVESAAQKIVVESNLSAHVDIRLERGATLSGSVRYDDGSPAPGVSPILLAPDKDGKWKPIGMTSMLPAVTDDRGHFRFYGIPAGKYAVQAALPTSQAMVGLGAGSISMHMNPGDALTVYSGRALREKDVKPVELGTGQDIDGVDIVFPISGLHSVSGSVVAKSDNHAVNSGSVVLEDSETKAQVRTAMLDQDGSFHLNYVPEGQYVLRVTGAADTEAKSGVDSGGSDFARLLNSKTIKSYGPAEMPLLLKSDAQGLVLQVPDKQSNKPRTMKAPAEVTEPE